jgi:hypothetical protein
MISKGNNVYGSLFAPDGLEIILDVIKPLLHDGKVYIYTSQFNSAKTLRLRSKNVDFGSEPLENNKHLLNGFVYGTFQDVKNFVSLLSKALKSINIQHSFEIYDENQELVEQLDSGT